MAKKPNPTPTLSILPTNRERLHKALLAYGPATRVKLRDLTGLEAHEIAGALAGLTAAGRVQRLLKGQYEACEGGSERPLSKTLLVRVPVQDYEALEKIVEGIRFSREPGADPKMSVTLAVITGIRLFVQARGLARGV